MEKDHKVYLDRRYIAGSISQDTPNEVVYEIATTMGLVIDVEQLSSVIYRAKVERTIDNITSEKVVTQPYQKKDLSRIALFVNPCKTCIWTERLLITALNWILEGHKTIPEIKDLSNAVIGNPTPDKVDTIPTCFLYKWCLNLGGKPNSSMTVDGLKEYCISLQTPKMDLMSSISLKLSMIDTSTLALISSMVDNSPFSDEFVTSQHVNTDLLIQSYNRLSTYTQEGCTITPLTFADAIVMEAMRSNTDISASKNPILEHRRLSQGLSVSDEHMKTILAIDSTAYSLNRRFNPLIPCDLYTIQSINYHAKVNNIAISNSKDAIYQELCYCSLLDSFHVGIMHGVTDFTTTIELVDLTDKDETSGTVIICYGSNTSKMTPYTITELTSMFMTTKNFKDPQGGSFSKESISKLKRIAEESKNPTPKNRRRKSEHYILWEELYQAISCVEIYQTHGISQADDLRREYDNMDNKTQDLIQNALKYLLKTGMSMRGWRGKGPYPLDAAPNNDDAVTEVLVDKYMQKYHTALSQLPDEGCCISDLPLMIYRDNNFIRSNSSEKGRTVGERITIVNQGNQTSNVHSCIRISSNWLVASAYLYLCALGRKPTFDISRLRYIS